MEQKADIINKILARLSVEVMEMELQKCEDDYCRGHVHGVNRAIYLIKELYAPEVTPKTFKIYPHSETTTKKKGVK